MSNEKPIPHNYYFARSLDRLSLLSSGRNLVALDKIANEHTRKPSHEAMFSIAKVHMNCISDRNFGESIKSILSNGVIDRLKHEAKSIIEKNNG